MTIPYTFATQSGSIPLLELDANFAATYNYTQGGTGSVTRTVATKLQESISVKDFGAVGDGVTDDTAAIQAAITYAASLGKIIFVPASTYRITSTLTKPQAFYGLNILGEGYGITVFNYSTLGAGASCIQIVGGSGSLCGCKIEGIKFIGNSGTIGIDIQGQDGQEIRRCQFDTNSIGVRFYNNLSGSFTEFCQAWDCDWTYNCATAVSYLVGSGNSSFHGSGIAGKSTLHNNGTAASIIIGQGANPYNAPLNLQLWTSAACNLILNSNSGTPLEDCWFVGNITMEQDTTGLTTLCSGTEGVYGPRTFLVGSVSSNTGYWQRGALWLCDQINALSGGALQLSLKPWSVQQSSVVNGSTVAFMLPYYASNSVGINNSLMLSITEIGSNYRYTHIAVVTPASGAGGSDTITVLATQQAFNTSGWGTSSFSINSSGQLVVTNASGGYSTTISIGCTQIGAGLVN